MRARKQHGRDNQGQFLTPTLEIRLPKTPTKPNLDVLRANPAREDCRFTMYGKAFPSPAQAFVKEFTGAERALMPPPVSLKRGKSKQVTTRAELPNTHSEVHVVFNTIGDPVAPIDRTAPGFPVSFCCRKNDYPVTLDRLDLDRIQRICGLDNLTKLDVLDLHENQISRIENVSHLTELRVLNLAGNCISRVENLQGLESLIELDLRHNHISSVTEVDRLPCLQRLFLSANSISSFDELACLGDSCSLSELTLDGNPVAQESCYKPTALRYVLPLRLLDMKRITEEDRRTANLLARKEDERKRESHRQAAHKEKRRLAIRNAAQQWEESRGFQEPPAQNGAKDELSPENSPTHSPGQTNGITLEPSPDELKRDRLSPLTVSERPAGGADSKLRSSSRPNSPRDPRLQEAGGASVQSLSLSESHVAELDGETVRLFGPGALDTLERGWGVQTASSVTTIAFRYIQFDSIVPTLPRIRLKFPNLTHLIFMETNISRLLQLAALAQVKRLEQVTIEPEGNPVVTINDVMAAERIFGTLGHVASTETPHCRRLLLPSGGVEKSEGRSHVEKPTGSHKALTRKIHSLFVFDRKRQLQFLLEGRVRRFGLSPEELRENGKLLGESMSRALFNYPSKDTSSESPEESGSEASERSSVVDQYLRGLVHSASSTSVKGEALHKLWPTMFVEMVRDCVFETRDKTSSAYLPRLALQPQTRGRRALKWEACEEK
ncbi:Leucine-rich repeat-containing protein 49 [Bagarius yarrelli]|uniref:Leucine-rich repeat-containing protein 49 n=1 Tax=Bagarius yarrelli TaxID=175774 RepID=A0A556TQK6_BAGYA|nr:Leucine-rich repeat-containing protein 49 [Bagarius yarrelli]